VPSPNGIGDNILFGVAAIASNDVWAVGNEGSLSTLAEHWDGAAWNIVPTPDFNPNATNEVLVGIVALSSDNIWTAGQYIVPLEGSAQFTLTENWDGSNWNFVPSPDKRNSNNRLHGITVTPNGTLWAVGTTGVFAQPERTLTGPADHVWQVAFSPDGSLLAACSVDGLAACVSWYGMLRYAEKTPAKPASPLELAPQLRCPYLGLFGADDAIIPPADVNELRTILDRTDQPHEIRVYAGAGHAFFNDTRPDAYRPDAAADAWPRALAFLHRHLG
jgi:hypothetical protein